jgi:hypothetical protein
MWTMSAFTSTSWIWGISAGLQAELYCLRWRNGQMMC